MSEEHPFKHVMIDYSVTMNDVLVERSRRVWNEESVRLIYSLESTLSLAQGHKVLGSWEIEIFATWGTFEHPRRRFIGRHKVPTVLDLEPGTALSAVISRVSMEHEWVKAEVERKAHEEALQRHRNASGSSDDKGAASKDGSTNAAVCSPDCNYNEGGC